MLYSFGNLILDPARRELRSGARLIPVEPQVFDLLVYLIGNRDRVVSRDDLIAQVWNGRIVSESTLATRINAARKAVGDDGTRQSLIKTIARKGVRFVGEVREQPPGAVHPPSSNTTATVHPLKVSFCRTSDNVNLAIGSQGQGPVLIKTTSWLNHLEYDLTSPIWSPLFNRLASQFHFVRYDGRGNGLSDRDVPEISFDGFMRDIEAVADAMKLDRFALLGYSQGASVAITYAVRHPERVSSLILYGGYALGRNRRGDPNDRERAQAMLSLIRQGWGDENSVFMRAFSSIFLPNGTSEQVRWFADLQRMTTSAEVAARLRKACDDIDVTDMLPRVRVPTLVLHARRDGVVPFEQGRLIAAGIPNAVFKTLKSENHVLLPGEPAWEQRVSEIEQFALAHTRRQLTAFGKESAQH